MKDPVHAVLIDHDDSFTFNLRHWLHQFIKHVEILNHREITSQRFSETDLIVLSPGPKHPNDYPHILNWLKNYPFNKPIFGVCLGMQMMHVSEGGNVVSYTPPLHGKTSVLSSRDSSLNNLVVARYHSLHCDGETTFQTLATSDDLKMWIQHPQKKWMGVQFHPESFLTENTSVVQNYVKHWLVS